MARPVWKGAISFGLVNIPVSLYLAAKSHRTSFHLLHAPDHGRIRYRKICELEDREVPSEEIVRGFEYEKGAYVEITDEDLDAIDIGIEKAISIERFVGEDEIDAFYFDRPYYLEPGKGAERPYALLHRAMRETGRVGVARVVFRDRESLAAVRPRGQVLALHTLRFADEVRSEAGLHLPSGEAAEVPEDQLELARLLVERLAGPWEPEQWEDRYEAALERLIARKLEGVPAPAAKPRPPAEVVDLAEMLRKSLAQQGEARGELRAREQASARRGRGGSSRKKGT
ncbi:MAG: Ku protein [Pseudomonadota bacterium]